MDGPPPPPPPPAMWASGGWSQEMDGPPPPAAAARHVGQRGLNREELLCSAAVDVLACRSMLRRCYFAAT